MTPLPLHYQGSEAIIFSPLIAGDNGETFTQSILPLKQKIRYGQQYTTTPQPLHGGRDKS